MTYEEFMTNVLNKYDEHPDDNIRLGQLFFNELLNVRPSIAEELRASSLDPFHRHRIDKEVETFTRERW
jgi:hypothetical protein